MKIIIFSIIFMVGIVCGFSLHLNYKPDPIISIPPPPDNRSSYMGFYCSNEDWKTSTEELRAPIYKKGKLKTEIMAQELIWDADGPIKLKSVKVIEFSINNNSIVAEMSGDCGTINLNEINEVESLKIWGNTKILKYANETKEEKP